MTIVRFVRIVPGSVRSCGGASPLGRAAPLGRAFTVGGASPLVRMPGAVSALLVGLLLAGPAEGQWVQRHDRWQLRGPWNWALAEELPGLYREFNGIDFGHAHFGETLLHTADPADIERARQQVLAFIFSAPAVPPDEEQIAPTLVKLCWELQRSFDWTHTLHRSLYDLYASDVADKDAAARAIVADYLSKPEALTSHALDHHGALWSFPESRSFRDRHAASNAQIWAYHWLQAGAADVQLMGDAARQRELMPRLVEHYHGYLRDPPLEWTFMPMFHEVAPMFAERHPDAATIFDNLHMLHDNVDDVLSRPDLFPTRESQRARILELLDHYLHTRHQPGEREAAVHAGGAHGHDAKESAHGEGDEEQPGAGDAGGHTGHAENAGQPGHAGHGGMPEGPRPPSAAEVVEPSRAGKAPEQQAHDDAH
jgi:hypothetical protein